MGVVRFAPPLRCFPRVLSSCALAVSAGACTLEFDPALLEGTGGGTGVAASSGATGVCDTCPDGQMCVEGECAPISPPAPGIALALGSGTTMAVDAGGRMFAWGDNRAGQIALGDVAETASPMLVSDGWSRAALGGEGSEHGCALRTDGSLLCFGRNDDGQLGDGSGTGSLEPVRVGTGSDWTSVAVGRASTCGVRSSGSIWCWGWNGDDRLGIPGLEGSAEPIQVDSLTDWTAVALTFTHACGLRDDASAWCWGSQEQGQLGRGGDRSPPAPVDGPGGWTRVVTGAESTCALRDDRSLWCWGRGDEGQLGFAGGASSPTRVGDATDWIDVSAGGRHACGVRRCGTD